MSLRLDPGPCPVCGAAHTACTSGAGPITSVMLAERDRVPLVAEAQPVPLVSESVPLKPGEISTATYRGKGKK